MRHQDFPTYLYKSMSEELRIVKRLFRQSSPIVDEDQYKFVFDILQKD